MVSDSDNDDYLFSALGVALCFYYTTLSHTGRDEYRELVSAAICFWYFNGFSNSANSFEDRYRDFDY